MVWAIVVATAVTMSLQRANPNPLGSHHNLGTLGGRKQTKTEEQLTRRRDLLVDRK